MGLKTRVAYLDYLTFVTSRSVISGRPKGLWIGENASMKSVGGKPLKELQESAKKQTSSPENANPLDTTVDRLMMDPKVYQAWERFGIGPFKEWVERIVIEYDEQKIDVYG